MASNQFLKDARCKYPIICGAMYPCSNPELVSAVAKAGAMAIIQPVSLTFVHGRNFRKGIQEIQSRAQAPVGLNLLIEKSSKTYLEKNKEWLEIALEEGVRFFVTALGKPDWFVERCHKFGAKVYHDVTTKKWAKVAIDGGVDGLICVNNRAGGHAGSETPEKLIEDLAGFGLPLVCAGGVGSPEKFKEMLDLGYSGVQMGTRFIATKECSAHEDYKKAILTAREKDIILTEKITGVPVSIINTNYMKKKGAKPNPLVDKLLKNNQTKHLIRGAFSIKSLWQLKQSNKKGTNYSDFFQAGKSVEGISELLAAKDIVAEYAKTIES